MNRDRYRLKFNADTGLWVPVAECMRARGKRGRSAARRTVIAAALALGLGAQAGAAGNLPVAAGQFVTRGAASVATQNNTMTITQNSSSPVLLQWNSFDIAKGYSVHFDQASSSMRAVNVVMPGGPRSDINGSLTAKGQVFLFNQAGIMFGESARVDVGGLVASSLKLNDKLIESALNSLGATEAAFSAFADGDYAGRATGDITVARGARIIAAKNGRVLLAAPNVNVGSRQTLDPGITEDEKAKLGSAVISAEEGQVVLAAGEKVYIADPLDSRLRGFLVEVDNGGKVTTESASELLSERGNITLVGLNIRHGGAARATTSVTLNGTIFLKARDGVTQLGADDMFPDAEALGEGETVMVAQNTGRIELAAGSILEIPPDEETKAQTIRDDTLFRRSEINLYGREVIIEDAASAASGARITAPSGLLRITSGYGSSGVIGSGPVARTYIGRHASIDLSGVDASAAADSGIVRVELRGTETAGSPLLNNAAFGRALYGEEIWVDTNVGTQLVDISGYLGRVERTVSERSAVGGDFVLTSQGSVLTHTDSRIDLSGGTVNYQAGTVGYSVLKSADGRQQAVESALADRVYTGVTDRTRTVAARLEGRDAGSITITANAAAVDGRIDASRTVGITQRTPGTRWVGPGVQQTIGVPQAGRFTLALDRGNALQNLVFVQSAPTRQLDAAAAVPDDILIRSDLFSGGVGSFSVSGVGKVTLPENVSIKVGPTALQRSDGSWSGSLFAIDGTSFNIDGTLTAAGGDIVLRTSASDPSVKAGARTVRFGERAHVSVAGAWVPDTRATTGGAVAVDAGSVTVKADGDVTLARGARIDASAGAWRHADGTLTLGDAGGIALLAGSVIDGSSGVPGTVGEYYGTLTLDGSVTAYGVTRGAAAGGSGTLELRSSRVLIDGRATGLTDGTLALGLDLFSDYGFSDFTVAGGNGITIGRADNGAFSLAPGVKLRALGALPGATAGTLDGIGTIATVARERREEPVSLAFKALSNLSGRVDVRAGARVAVDAGGSIALTGNRDITVAGSLSAPGGSIRLAQEEAGAGTNLDSTDFGDIYRGASIHLAPTAVLDVSGTFLRIPDLPYADGTVFDGGDITLAARRGYLVVQDGAQLRADGTSAVLSQRVGSSRQNVRIDSNGGSIVLNAREGLYADPVLSAKAGGSNASGGALTVELVQGGNAWQSANVIAGVNRPRELEIMQDGGSGASALAPGATIDSATYAGRGVFALDRLNGSGIIDLALRATDINQYGALTFTEDVNASVAGRLVLDSANLVGRNGADVALAASVVDWRNTGRLQQNHAQATSTAAGDGTLTLAADLLSVSGNLAADRFSKVNLSARGDLRATAAGAYFAEGSTLATSGDLTLTAAQLYPTSGSKYSFEVQNNAQGTLVVRHSGGTPGAVYSALGELTLAAPDLVQDGRVVAPLGTVNLRSQTVTRSNGIMASATRAAAPDGKVELTAGSVTSVSANGLLLPFGQTTLSGTNWVYNTGTGEFINVAGAPEKAVNINGENVIVAGAADGKPAARVDLSGGGDIQGWEWVPGSGGPADILAAAEGKDAYAIVPMLGNSWLPYDTAMQAEAPAGLQPGQSITLLADANGLKAGTYALLPARYALLPGAYLVQLSRGDQSVAAGQAVTLADGTAQVSVRDTRVTANGSVTGGKSFVAQLLTQEQVRQRAEYLLSNSADVFKDGRSTADAGRLSLQVGRSLQLAGVLDTGHAAGARGAQLDVTARALALLGDGATARDGEVGVSVAALNALNAESIVLGGTRRGVDAGTGATLLDTRDADAGGQTLYGAASVRLDNADGPALAAPDVVLVARDDVVVEAGSAITASGSATPGSLQIVGSGADADGALLRVSTADAAAPLRDAPTGTRGTLTLGSGARITAASVVLDSTLNTDNRGAGILLPASGGHLALSGSTVSVGAVPAGTGGLVFDNSALAGLGNPRRLTLKSYGSLDLYGDVTLGSDRLALLRIDTAGIVGHDNAGIVQHIAAGEVQLANSSLSSQGVSTPAGSAGALSIEAETVRLDGGAGFAVRGFDTVAVQASKGTVLGGKGTYDFDAGTVTLATPRVSATAGANVDLRVSGALAIVGTGGVADAATSAVGGVLSATAREIGVHALIDLPSGRVALTATGSDAATGSVTVGRLTDGAGTVTGDGRIVVAGTQKDYLGKTVTTSGGSVVLESRSGDVRLVDGALVDVSAAGAGNAGSVALLAAEGGIAIADGALRAHSSGGAAGGALQVDTRELASLDALASASGDFSRRWEARVRSGDSRLDGNIKAQEIVISTDAGSLALNGTLDASGTAKGGRIELSARRADGYQAGDARGAGDVRLEAGAVLDARATVALAAAEGTQGEGGTVLVSAAPADAAGNAGTLRIADGARIVVGNPDGSAARDGVVTLRAARGGSSGVNIDGNVANAITGVRDVFVEGSRVYDVAAGSTVNLATAHGDATAFMSSANVDAVRAALGLTDDAAGVHHVRPHIELRSDGDLTMAATDLSALTYLGGTEAGALSVRAGGTLNVTGTVSDGFGKARSGAVTNVLGALTATGLSNTTYFDLGARDTAWSIQLASGADTAGARGVALQSLAALEAANRGDLVIGADAQVRTGAGDIEIAAGRDLKLTGAKSAIYTAGYQDDRGTAFDAATQLNINGSGNRRGEYAQDGGDVTVVAQRDVSAAQSDLTLGGWLFRQGRLESDGTISGGSSGSLRNPAWYARIDQFGNGLATFGGGDVTVRAGGDIDNLTVATASNGRLFGEAGTKADAANLKVLGGGDITVAAGGDIGSANIYIDRGTLHATAGGAFDSARSNGAGSVLALGDAHAVLQATGSIDLETVTSATMVQQLAASRASSRETYFIGYGSDNGVEATSFGGAVTLDNAMRPWGSENLFLTTAVLPGSLSLVAMGGDLNVGGDMVLTPSTRNDVLLAAAGDVNLRQADGGSGVRIRIADSAPERVPSVLAPALNANSVDYAALINFGLVSGRNAHDEALNAARDVLPVRIVAEHGDIDVPFNASDLKLTLYSPQPVLVEAGGDIRNLAVRAQHFSADDLTRMRAGGDITFDAVVDAAGQPRNGIREGIQVGGKGKVEVIAGGGIDLANSIGIVTRGNYDNPALPEGGASITVQAGSTTFSGGTLLDMLRPVADGTAGNVFDAIILKLAGSGDLDAVLGQEGNGGIRTLRAEERARIAALLKDVDAAIVGWMRDRPGSEGLSDTALRAGFDQLPSATRDGFFADHRAPFEGLLNAGLRYAGLLGDLLGSGATGYAPGIALIEGAFGAAAQGDINVFYSQVKSEQGGDVNVYAPGGSITVGVAGTGASTQAASRQGLFAIGAGEINAVAGADFQLGPSRVFTLGGGDIQIWSSYGDIDAGKGSSTASATPPPQVIIRGDQVVLDLSASVSGSGIGTLKKSDDVADADIRLFAPSGAVIAADAGIRSTGDVRIGADRVLGDNIRAGGTVGGSATVAAAAPAAVPSAPPPAEANNAVDAGQNAAAAGDKEERERNSILTVELVGLGETATASGCSEQDPERDCKDKEKETQTN
jgi:filamentous hemagglutinin